MRKKRSTFLLPAILLSTWTASAQDHLKLQFNVDHVSGKSVTDPVSGMTAQLMIDTSVISYGSRHRLGLGNGTGGWDSEVGMETGSAAAKGKWTHVIYRQSGQQGKLFIGGKKAVQAAGLPMLSKVFTAVPAYSWIGRAPFTTDSYQSKTA